MEHYGRQRLIDARAAERAQAVEILTRCANERRERTAEEDEMFARADAAYDRIDKQIQDIDKLVAGDKRFEEIDAEKAERRAFENGTSTSVELSTEARYEQAFADFIVRGEAGINAEQRSLLEARAMGVVTGVGGGFTAPEGWWAKVTETMLWYGGMMSVGCEMVSTDTGNPLSWPTNDDTANTGSWIAENVDNGSATDLTFGQKTLYAHGLTSGVLKVSRAYLNDTDPQTSEGFLARKLGQRLGRALNTALTTGNGINKPYGIINGLSTGKTTAGATAITAAEIIDLEHSVDFAYRGNPGVGYMMHDLILAYVRKIQDSQNRPIFTPSYMVGAPNTINGRPYTINNDMDSTVATTKKTIAFGDFTSAYVIRTVNGSGGIQRLVERYAEFQQVGFLSFARYDGNIQDTSAVKLLVQA